MIAFALAPIVQGHGLHDVALWFREGFRNLPARKWLTNFTGVQDIALEGLTIVAWDAIPHLNEYLHAPIKTEWEKMNR